MGKKPSVTTGARRLSLRALAITGMLVAASATTGSAAPSRGVWKLRGGQTLNLTNMTIDAGDLDNALLFVDGTQVANLGNNSGDTGPSATPLSLAPFSYMNAGKRTQKVTLAVQDTSAGGVGCPQPYFSDGPNALTSSTQFSIDDGGGGCNGNLPPASLTLGNFTGDVSVG
jgi:hypothetical protein